ncbi:hypothetical protein FHETE_127 [Fusarium heterosporum]|uniref:Uncharacterized protein n=1 Tax=Fusarium heterosporum TaxID=42747 RepID=A0A8H5U363_FUSHE|nr:hypothetical protein FHETE_127 [Fusarium heterosporum]
MVCTTDIQTIDDVAAPEYWAEVTTLKVLFPNEFLQSRHVAIAQNKFPNANINEWKPNENDSVFTLDTDDFGEMHGAENLRDFETQLASIRKAAEENTQISPQTIDFLRHAYHDERKKEREAQDDEISTLRTMYESVVSTFIKGSINGMKALRIVRRDVSKRKKNKKKGQKRMSFLISRREDCGEEPLRENPPSHY